MIAERLCESCQPVSNAASARGRQGVAARRLKPLMQVLLLAVLLLATGCGITRTRLATEQLVISDAVDQAVARIDFRPLSGKRVFFDTKYLTGLKFPQGANVEYVISSLRQQMMAYDCRLQEKVDDADFVVEARIGALGNDGVEMTYGVPGTATSTASLVLMGTPTVGGAMPELSVGRRNHHMGAAKIGLFAYDRATREPVWQAGVSSGTSEAHDYWVLGLGPYQTGRIHRTNSHPSMLPHIFPQHDPPPTKLDAYTQPALFERALITDEVSPTPPASSDPAQTETSTAGR